MTPVPPAPAATCVLLREGADAPEIFLVRRTTRASFMAGAYVFPGGRLDAADAGADASWCDGLDAARARWPDLAPDEAVAYHVAAIREIFEEAGLLAARDGTGRFVAEENDARAARLREARAALHAGDADLRTIVAGEGLRLALDALLPLAHWVTPAVEAKRFDARFFVARAPRRQAATHDAAETIHSAWMTAADALARCARGEIALPPPTWSTLRDLARFDTVDAALASTRDRAIFRREPRFFEEGGARLLALPGDPLYPAPDAERMTHVHPETRFLLEGDGWRAARHGD